MPATTSLLRPGAVGAPRRGTGRAPVVIGSELPNNRGTSVTYAAEQLAAEVIRSHRLPTPLVWIEHWPREATDGGEETFELVDFSSYKVTERAPYLGQTRAWGMQLGRGWIAPP